MYWSLLRMKRKKVNLYGYKATQCPGGAGKSGTLQRVEGQKHWKKSCHEGQVRFLGTSVIRRLLQVVGFVRSFRCWICP